MPENVTARGGLPYPSPGQHARTWEYWQALAERVAGLLGARRMSELQRDALEGTDLYDGRPVFNIDASRVEIYDADAGEWLPAVDTPDDVLQVVEHGSDATVARPATAKRVLWDGTAQPDNGASGDLWARASDSHVLRYDDAANAGEGGWVDPIHNATQRLGPITADTAFQVPTDYATLQEAIDDLSTLTVEHGTTITVNIETGHQPTAGIYLEGRSLEFIRLTSDDPVVTVDPGFTGHFMEGHQARMPVFAILVDMNDLGGDGYNITRGSVGIIEGGSGIRNAGGRGIYLSNSVVYAQGAESTGANEGNVWATRNATFDGEGGDFSGSKGNHGVTVRRSSLANLNEADISDCIVSFAALDVIRSRVHATDCNVSGSSRHGISARGASAVAAGRRLTGTIGTGCDEDGVNATEASIVDVSDSDFSNAGRLGVFAQRGAVVNFHGGTADGCGNFGVRATNGATISAAGATVTNNATAGVGASDGARVNVASATVTGNPSGLDLQTLRGSQIAANGCSTSSGSPSTADANVSSFNAIDGSNGIIWS